MKCKKITIETEGTAASTKIYIDGVPQSGINSFLFSINVDGPYVNVQMTKYQTDGTNIKTKDMKVRNEKNQKFEIKKVAQVDAVQIEFESMKNNG